MSFPVDRSDNRVFADDWAGTVVICDIDRTYLNTRFSSLKGMARIPLEFAVDKRDIPGMVPLLQELRRGPGPESRFTPLYFLSASPPQMRGVLERKMLMDGIEHDGTTFKDWPAVLRSGRLRRLKEQLGFKLTALLHGRMALPRGAEEVLIGDDLESDPLAFALYADILAGRVPVDGLPQLLIRLGVGRQDAWGVADLKKMLPDVDGVRRAYIRLERNDDPGALHTFFPGILPCRDAFQMSLSMLAEGLMSRSGVVRVGRGLADRGAMAADLATRLSEAVKQGFLGPEQAVELGPILEDADLLDPAPPVPEPDPLWTQRPSADRRWVPEQILAE